MQKTGRGGFLRARNDHSGAICDGRDPAFDAAEKGFGHVVIERVASQALNASVVYEFPKEGVRWSIAIPLDLIVRGRSLQPDAVGAAS